MSQLPVHGKAQRSVPGVDVAAELTIEPFVPGSRGPHVQAATEAAREAGVEVDMGPFGDRIRGDETQVLDALRGMLRAALEAGATRISIQVTAGA
jgi:uncharacterized protein YqgV (UPF0045/DUF77 family)